MASAGVERRPGAQERTAAGPPQLAESSGGHVQSCEVTVRLCSLQILVRGALGGQTLCDAPLTARTSSTGREGHGLGALHLHLMFVRCLMTDPLYLLPGDQLPICHL